MANINDHQVISRFQALKRTSEEITPEALSPAEEEAISQGLQSIKAGMVKSHKQVSRLTKEKYL